MKYNRDGDFYICHNGKKVERTGVKIRKTSSGYLRMKTHYECSGCPYKEKCLAGKNRKKPPEKRYKKLTVSRLSEEMREEEYRLIISHKNNGTVLLPLFVLCKKTNDVEPLPGSYVIFHYKKKGLCPSKYFSLTRQLHSCENIQNS